MGWCVCVSGCSPQPRAVGRSRMSPSVSVTRREQTRLHLDALALPDDHDAAVRDGEALAIAFEVDTDLRAVRDDDVLVEDRVANDRVPPDVAALHDHRVREVRPG